MLSNVHRFYIHQLNSKLFCRGGNPESFHFWIGLHLSEGEEFCTACQTSSITTDCVTCRNKFVWVDGSLNVPDFWGSHGDPGNNEKCVRLRNPLDGQNAWAAHTCDTELMFICKAGNFR